MGTQTLTTLYVLLRSGISKNGPQSNACSVTASQASLKGEKLLCPEKASKADKVSPRVRVLWKSMHVRLSEYQNSFLDCHHPLQCMSSTRQTGIWKESGKYYKESL